MANDRRNEPRGPERMPHEQPPPNPTDLTNQKSLQQGSSSRWLVPAAVLAGIITLLMLWAAFTNNWVIPIFAIAFVVVIWVAMFLVSRKPGPAQKRNVTLAWLMGAMAAGGLLAFLTLYLVEASFIIPDSGLN